MYQLNIKRYQWVIDLLFGIGFILPMALYMMNVVQDGAVLVSIGIGIGYMLHVTQKMLVFSDMLDSVVEDKVKNEANKQVEEKATEQVDEKLDDKVEDKVEEKATEQVDEKLDDKVEDKVEEKIQDKK